jgi:hypothetical protein
VTSKINDGGAAYPVATIDGYTQYGMSLRDWFAGMALQGMMVGAMHEMEHRSYAEQAYAYADAMLKARNTQGD